MKKIAMWCYAALSLLICIVPSAGMLFYEGETAENRTLSAHPAFILDDGAWNSGYFQELQAYLAEHFAFRGELIEAGSRLKYSLFHTPGDDQVLLGKDGWLFFDETLMDYAGAGISDGEIENIAGRLCDVCSYIASKGKKPLIVIVPNKSSIYPEYMPTRFGSGSSGRNLTRLQKRMGELGIPFVDAYSAMLDGKKYDELYLHEDTHWNNTGARLVLNKIYESYGLAERHSLADYTVEENHRPDLYGILFPMEEHYEAQRIYDDMKEYRYIGRMHGVDDMLIRTAAADGNGKSILVYRDSFGRAWIPYIGGIFDAATFNRSTPYDLSLIESAECDYVLIEIVERSLKDLGGMALPPKK